MRLLRIKLLAILQCGLVITLAFSIQGPAMMIQQVAWVSMAFQYSQDQGVVLGLRNTLDGAHPCSLCHQADAVQRQNDEQGDRQRRDSWVRELTSAAKSVPTQDHFHHRVLPIAAATDGLVEPLGLCGRLKDSPLSPPPEQG